MSLKEKIEIALKNPEFEYIKLKTWSKHEGNDGGFILAWSAKYIGFGEIAFYNKDNQVYCDSETMGKDFCEKVLIHFFNQAKEHISYIK